MRNAAVTENSACILLLMLEISPWKPLGWNVCDSRDNGYSRHNLLVNAPQNLESVYIGAPLVQWGGFANPKVSGVVTVLVVIEELGIEDGFGKKI